MNGKKLNNTHLRLSGEYKNLIKSINRNRVAAEEIRIENTEDESDLVTISRDKDRLRFIQEAANA